MWPVPRSRHRLRPPPLLRHLARRVRAVRRFPRHAESTRPAGRPGPSRSSSAARSGTRLRLPAARCPRWRSPTTSCRRATRNSISFACWYEGGSSTRSARRPGGSGNVPPNGRTPRRRRHRRRRHAVTPRRAGRPVRGCSDARSAPSRSSPRPRARCVAPRPWTHNYRRRVRGPRLVGDRPYPGQPAVLPRPLQRRPRWTGCERCWWSRASCRPTPPATPTAAAPNQRRVPVHRRVHDGCLPPAMRLLARPLRADPTRSGVRRAAMVPRCARTLPGPLALRPVPPTARPRRHPREIPERPKHRRRSPELRPPGRGRWRSPTGPTQPLRRPWAGVRHPRWRPREISVFGG